MGDISTTFACQVCGNTLLRRFDGALYCRMEHKVALKDGVYDFLDDTMNDITIEDAVYHDSVKESWLDLNQLETLRNKCYHNDIIQWIMDTSRSDAVLVELGGGVGYDLELLLNSGIVFKDYVFSEISHELAKYVKNRIGKSGEKVTFCTLDAGHLPFVNGGVDIVFMVAAFHHFPDIDGALSEMFRVLRPGGHLMFGIEPNQRMIRFLNFLKKPFRNLVESKSHSAADEQAEGFTMMGFRQMAVRQGLEVLSVQPVWLFNGFLHYGLEMLYRVLRLKQRIRLPLFLEKMCVSADEFLFRIKPFHEIAWHYTVVMRKPTNI
jgi:ubiquinone/menaquinone biosynthesis C-methylase UbiE